ncbi:MAG: hypothetical protein V3S52_08135 [Gemmatimonadota bacterium]
MSVLLGGSSGSRALVWIGRGLVRYGFRRLRREVSRPWRQGRRGAAADIGRVVGATLAVGAKTFGVGAALYVILKRR